MNADGKRCVAFSIDRPSDDDELTRPRLNATPSPRLLARNVQAVGVRTRHVCSVERHRREGPVKGKLVVKHEAHAADLC
jgi:hypothetical protein